MNWFRRIIVFIVMLAVTAGVLFAIRRVEYKLDASVKEERLRFTGGELSNAPPAVVFASMALGSFRGLIADLLWLRSENLKQEKSYYELVQLARWITDLQPNYSGGTAYLAWNLAYNISVTCSDHNERWRWVNEGISLLRDKALEYNPEDPVLYKELAWIFQHKLGNVLDDAHLLYKVNLGRDMTYITGSGYPNWEAMAAIAPGDPATDKDFHRKNFMKLYPENSRFWEVARSLGYPDYETLFKEFKDAERQKKFPAQLPEPLLKKLNEEVAAKRLSPEDPVKIDFALRAALLWYRMKMIPGRIVAMNRHYGTLDWRVPESHAIYWANVGIDKTPGKEDLRCARLITQSLQASFRNGMLHAEDDMNLTVDTVTTIANVALADITYKTYQNTQEKYDKESGAYSSFRSARINFLKDAIPMLFIFGDMKKTRDFFDKLVKEDGQQLDPKTRKPRSMEEVIRYELYEDIRDADVKKAQAIINALIRRHFYFIVVGDWDVSVSSLNLAISTYNDYLKDNHDLSRNSLPPLPMLYQNELEFCRRSMHPENVKILDAFIAAQKSQARQEQNNKSNPGTQSTPGQKGRN